MTTTPPPPLPDNLDDEAAVRAWIAATSKPGTPPPPPAEDDLGVRRLELCAEGCAAMVLWFGLGGIEPGVTAAVDKVEATCGCGQHAGLFLLPLDVANAAVDRLQGSARQTAYDALHDHVTATNDAPPDTRAKVERLVWRMLTALRDALSDGEVDALRLRCVTGDHDFELRCRRAGLMATLAGRLDDDHLAVEALRAARREVIARRHGLTEHAVFCIAGPTVRTLAQQAVSLEHFDAMVRSELLAIDAAMVYPHARVGGIEP